MDSAGYKVEVMRGWRELSRFRGKPIAYVSELSQGGVDIRQMRVGRRNLFLVNEPDLIRDVLVTHDWNFIKGRALRSSKLILGDGLLTSEGELHRRQRRLVQPAFHSARLAAYAAVMTGCADGISEGWRGQTRCAVDQEMLRLTLQIVARTLFSADIVHEANSIGESLTGALHLFMKVNSPMAQLVPPVRYMVRRKAARSRQDLQAVLLGLVADHREHPEKYDDMLSMLMSAHDESSTSYMSDELLLDECLTLFLAGHETTANAMTWCWYLLAQHPAEESALHAELDAVLAGRLPTLEDLPNLPYTGWVFREALRMYPPAWVITREALTPYRLGPVDVPAGSTIMMSPYATHHDPRYWSEPERFRPMRWRAPEHPKFAFFPFGAGTRVCIGEHFAMMEGVLLLAAIAQRWSLGLATGQKVEMWPQLTLRPKGPVYFSLKARS